MMSESDKETFKQGRPYVIGILAALLRLRDGRRIGDHPEKQCFDEAEEFVAEFERRNHCE